MQCIVLPINQLQIPRLMDSLLVARGTGLGEGVPQRGRYLARGSLKEKVVAREVASPAPRLPRHSQLPARVGKPRPEKSASLEGNGACANLCVFLWIIRDV